MSEVSQGPPFMGSSETSVIHIHMRIPEPGVVTRTLSFVFQDWLISTQRMILTVTLTYDDERDVQWDSGGCIGL
jgi:hypothetical protein